MLLKNSKYFQRKVSLSFSALPVKGILVNYEIKNHTRAHTQSHAHAYTHTHTHTHARTDTHTYTHTQVYSNGDTRIITRKHECINANTLTSI